MLMMRRHERDSMLHGDESYGAELRKRVAEFEALLAAIDLADSVKAELKALIESYQQNFVVATEVRSLAQRSAQAAKDIKTLIAASSGQVKHGVDLVNRAGGTLGDISAAINAVAAVVADVANASAEQAVGVEQINRALARMDEMTQQNSALVEENAATTGMLERQAKAMTDRVAFFRVADDGDGAGQWTEEQGRHRSPVGITQNTAAAIQNRNPPGHNYSKGDKRRPRSASGELGRA